MRTMLCAIALAASIAAPAAAQARTVTFDDLRKEVSISTPQISPDGKSVAFVVSRPDFEKDQDVSQLMLADVATGAQRALTQKRDDVNSPLWSPTGDRIAFLAKSGDGDDAQDQLFVMAMNGGDPIAVTTAKNGVRQFVWSPDGSQLAFVAGDEAPKKTGSAKFDNPFQVGDNDFLARRIPQPAHVWVVSASGGDARRLTSGTWSLPQGQFASTIDWSADGKEIAFVAVPDTINAHWYKGSVELVDVATGKTRPLGANAGYSGNPLFAPDGQSIAFALARDGDPYFETDVAVSSVAKPSSTDVTNALDRNVTPVVWAPDGKSLLVAGDDHAQVALWRQPLGGAATRIDIGDLSFGGGTVAKNGTIAFVAEDGTRPPEVYVLAPSGTGGTIVASGAGHAAGPQRLTHFNDTIADLDLGRVASIDWQSSDGMAEDGVLTYPPGFDPAKKYPLVLMIHGGPIAASTETFDDYAGIQQIAAAHGWVVFEPNYRGSDNLGDAFLRAIVGHVASGPGRDNLEGVAAVEKLGFVDTSKIGVSGWSGGGLQTTWLIGQSHIWRAAVAGAAVTNWVDQYALADISGGFTDTFFGGSPWDPKYSAAYLAESPITYARHVTTPTLILSDTGDYRVPTPQAYEFYHALRDNHVEAKFVAAPRYGHFPSDPAGREAVLKLWIGWFEEHFK